MTDYHALPGLSSSGARKLLPPSCPARFKWELDNPPPPRDVFDFGHAAHRFVLGAGEEIAPLDYPDKRSKAYKEADTDARANGLVPLLRKDYDTALAMADALRQSDAAHLFHDGQPEVIYQWEDGQTGAPLRAMLDWWSPWLGQVVDYKTAKSADPATFSRAAFSYGYHIQAAWYLEALAQDDVTDAEFLFVVQEKVAPFLVTVVKLDEVALEIGRRRMRQAIDLYAKCLESGEWPGYADDVVTVPAPAWAVNDYFDTFAPDDIQVD